MMGWLIWGIYLGIALTIGFSIFQWLAERYARKQYSSQREQNIEEERAWLAAHGQRPTRAPKLPDLDQQPEPPAEASPPAPEPEPKAAKPRRAKPSRAGNGKAKPAKTAKPAASRPARPRAARPPRAP